MKRISLLLLTMALAVAVIPAQAQVGKSLGVLDANTASEKDLLGVPHMNAALVKSILEKRPFASITELNTLLSASLNKQQITEVYGKTFVHINLNTATTEEILLIPGSGPRTAREFQEYRPYAGLAVFHREMRKYWDEAEVSRLEQYVFVPIKLNTATDADILTIPGSGPRVVREFKEYRPYTSMAQFEREMRKYWDAKEVARLQRYVTLNYPSRFAADFLMEYVNLGSTGLKVSRIALGTMGFGSRSWRKWALEEDESRPFIRRALDLGINFFDTADMYSLGVSEQILGRALKDFGAQRDRIVIGTKVFSPMSDDPNDRGLSRKHILSSIDRSLERLGTDYVDLYLMHRWDPQTPVEETLVAMHDVVKSGKALYFGASTMYAWQFAKLVYTADRLGVTRPVCMQSYYNLLYREEEREMFPLCRAEGIAITPYSPIARGFVTGERRKEDWGDTVRAKTDDYMKKLYYTPQDFAIVERLTQVARKRDLPNVQVALAWVLHQPGITAPIVGVTKLEQLDQLVGSLSVKLETSELAALSEVYQPHEVVAELPRPKN